MLHFGDLEHGAVDHLPALCVVCISLRPCRASDKFEVLALSVCGELLKELNDKFVETAPSDLRHEVGQRYLELEHDHWQRASGHSLAGRLGKALACC